MTVTLTAGSQQESAALIARPGQGTPFDLALATPSPEPVVVTVDVPGEGCPVGGLGERAFAQVLDLAGR